MFPAWVWKQRMSEYIVSRSFKKNGAISSTYWSILEHCCILCIPDIHIHIAIGLGQFCARGKGAMRLALCDVTLKMQETVPTVHNPSPRRLERLAICRCSHKGSTLPWRHFTTPSVGLVRNCNQRPSAQQSGTLATELTRMRFRYPVALR